MDKLKFNELLQGQGVYVEMPIGKDVATIRQIKSDSVVFSFYNTFGYGGKTPKLVTFSKKVIDEGVCDGGTVNVFKIKEG